ncbi:MAG: CapA family protein [Lachnospiraceae bacterium]|nr:CapA family protein [Lachnospiraceae bacterium]
MKKNRKKKMIYFVVALVSTLVLGALALAFYVKMTSHPQVLQQSEQTWSPDVVSEDPEQLEVIETDERADMQTDAQQEATVEEVVEKGSVTLTFGGDICFHDPFANMGALNARGGSIESCIDAALLAEMRNSDICMVNNEFPYSDRGTPIPEKAFAFRSRPENVNLLHEMGVDIVSLANNHAYDHGEIALLDTFDVLEKAGVEYAGAGRNLSDASEPVIMEINGLKVGLLAATQIERLDTPDTKGATENAPGVLRCFNEKELNHFLELVAEAEKECDVLIVYIHWGTENTDELDWAQPYQADLISKAGADLIVGAHPHCLQGLDSVNGVPVIYSLGNYWFNSKPLDTALLKIVVGSGGVETVQILPARQQDCATSMLYDGEKERVLNYLQSLSPNVALDGDGFMTW